jgi:predicted Zn-dependent peptidase
MEIQHFITLSNGIRVAYQQMPLTKIFHCGLFLDVGSRDESLGNQGIAHFWEHMAFKGTHKRNSFQIISSLDAVGGELNAFTDKEKVVFYASVRDQFAERAMDVLADIAFKSVFPEQQIERERGVILEEMAMYFDTPDDSLHDEFDAVVFKNHPLGMNILGNTDSVRSLKRKDFISFLDNHIDTTRIVLSCVGSFSFEKVERLARKYFEVKKSTRKEKRKKAGVYKPLDKELMRAVKQARCAIGRNAYPVLHENRIPFFLLVNMLGGPGMNSRLNLSLREKYGFVYSIDAHYISYTDTGMFAVFFGTEPRQLDKCITLVQRELNKFCEKPLSARQLSAAKEQIKGQLAMSEENNLSHMMMMGRSILDRGRVPSLEEIFIDIEETSAQKLLTIAQEMFDPEKLSYLKMIPTKN